MATKPESLCFADAPPIATDVARGVTRLLCRQDLFAVCEVPLPNGRRADLMAIDSSGGLPLGDFKVAKEERIGARQWLGHPRAFGRCYWEGAPHPDRCI